MELERMVDSVENGRWVKNKHCYYTTVSGADNAIVLSGQEFVTMTGKG